MSEYISAPRPRLGDRITLNYRIRAGEREIVDTFQDGPDTFVLGSGDIDGRLESLLLGQCIGQRLRYVLSPDEAFGAYDPSLVSTMARSEFAADELNLHDSVEFDLPNGNKLTGHILNLDTDLVRIDFNHPLAGLPIEFEAEILAIHAASHSG